MCGGWDCTQSATTRRSICPKGQENSPENSISVPPVDVVSSNLFTNDYGIVFKVGISKWRGKYIHLGRNLQAGGEYEDKDEDFRRSPYNDKDTEDIRRYS
ncbi:hypothetical protein Tco_0066905 [Tanacetum coccineum]